jgi:kynurenine formamidase
MTQLEHARTRCTLLLLALSLTGCQTQQPEGVGQIAAGILEGVSDGRTRVIDLTHSLSPANPYWPGPGYEPFAYETFATIESDGVLSGRFAMAEHTGTHLDAPNHFVEGQIPLDQIPPQQLIVPAAVLDVRETVTQDSDYQLTPAEIRAWEAVNGNIPPGAIVFLYTGWDARWDDFDSYRNRDENGRMHFPGFSAASAEFLVVERMVAGLGIDTLSVDYGASENFEVHHISHGNAKYHVENAANLGAIPPLGAWVIVAPIKIEDGTGGPARVFALVRN